MYSYRHRGGQGRIGNWPGRGSIGEPTPGHLTYLRSINPTGPRIIPNNTTDTTKSKVLYAEIQGMKAAKKGNWPRAVFWAKRWLKLQAIERREYVGSV